MNSTEGALATFSVRLNARAWGLAVGLLFGLGLFIATNILVIKGGAAVGPHLGLLAAYLPGYRVTLGGSLIGFVYGFALGYLVGWTIGRLYNLLARVPDGAK
jgi:hypothetical protein